MELNFFIIQITSIKKSNFKIIFYMRDKFNKIIISKYLDPNNKIMVNGAGPVDLHVFSSLGFKRVKFTNLIIDRN